MQKNLKEKMLVKDKWIRGLLMILFVLIKSAVSSLISIIALFQFVADLLFSKPNIQLLAFTAQLNTYLLQLADFLTFNSEVRPFPFTNWPEKQ